MTRLKMHWQLVLETDGRKHVQMEWERARARIVLSPSNPEIRRCATRKQIRSPFATLSI